MRVLLTRPRADSEPLAAALRDRGIDSLIAPLLEIVYIDGPALDLGGVQALLATSANGVRAFARRSAERDLPVYAVGDATAREATESGFTTVRSAAGDVETLAERAIGETNPEDGAMLHPAGTRVAGDLAGRLEAAGFIYRREVLYHAEAAAGLDAATRNALRQGDLDGVMLFSPRTARTFVQLMRDADLEASAGGLTAWCLSAAVAAAATRLPWQDVVTAPRPDQDALLAAVTEFGQ